MAIRTIFFDTSALIKFFIYEEGSDVVKWICNDEIRSKYSLHYSISEYVKEEFYKKMDHFKKTGKITTKQAKRIYCIAPCYFRDFFKSRDRDNKPIPIYDDDNPISAYDIIKKYDLNPEKDNGDAKILSCMINFMRYLEGTSKPTLVTSDKKFKRVIKEEMYAVIDPQKMSIVDVKKYFESL